MFRIPKEDQFAIGVDWLQGSLDSGHFAAATASSVDLDSVRSEICELVGMQDSGQPWVRDDNRYKFTLKISDSLIFKINPPGHRQKSYLEMKGTYWGKRSNHGHILRALQAAEFKASRIDIAIDVFHQQLHTGRIRKEILELERTKKITKGYIENAKGGGTIYLGSRKSDKMLRVYDKGLQQGVTYDGDWVRFEGEFKRGMARVMFDVAKDDIVACAPTLVAMLNAEGTKVEKLLNDNFGRGSVSKQPVRKSTNKEAWLYGAVVSAIVSYVVNNGGDLDEYVGFLQAKVRKAKDDHDRKRSTQLRLL